MTRNLKYILPNLRSFYYLLCNSLRKYESQTISGIIFSKDRPIQLDTLLRSYNLYSKETCTLTVLFNTSNSSFDKAYNELKLLYPLVVFIKENSFRNDLILLLHNVKSEFVFFLVDDMVFIKLFSLSEIIQQMDSNTIFSMRLGTRINWCETGQKEMNPLVVNSGAFLNWEWSCNKYDWGYRFSVDGNVFKTNEVLSSTMALSFKAPNSYEGLMNTFLIFKFKKKGVSFIKPVVVNLVLNKTQAEAEYDNLFGEISLEDLLEYWEKGCQFDIEKISRFNFNSVHKILNNVPLIKREYGA